MHQVLNNSQSKYQSGSGDTNIATPHNDQALLYHQSKFIIQFTKLRRKSGTEVLI